MAVARSTTEGLWFAHSVKMGLMAASQQHPDRPAPIKEGEKVVRAELDNLNCYLHSDPLSYWGMRQDQWPSLSAVALRYLASPQQKSTPKEPSVQLAQL